MLIYLRKHSKREDECVTMCGDQINLLMFLGYIPGIGR